MADFEYVTKEHATESSGPKPPLDFSYHFSRVTAARAASSMKQFYRYFGIPGIANLAGGKSHPQLGIIIKLMLAKDFQTLHSFLTRH